MTLMKALILLWLFCSLITASSSEFPAGRPRVPSHSNGISTAVSSSPIRYQGSAYEGLDERVWRLGGATITVQVASDLTFQFPNTLLDGSNNERAREEYRVRQLLSVLGTPSSETSALTPLAEEELQTLTEQCIRPAVATSRTTITNGGKLVKIVLGPAPDCTMSSPVLIGVQLPLSFVKITNLIRSPKVISSARRPSSWFQGSGSSLRMQQWSSLRDVLPLFHYGWIVWWTSPRS